MQKLSLQNQAGVVFLLAGRSGGITKNEIADWARRIERENPDPPNWVQELIQSEGADAQRIIAKYGGFDTPQDYAALAEYCHRNRLGNDVSISVELYSMWQYFDHDPDLKDDVNELRNASNMLFTRNPAGGRMYGKFLEKYRRLEGQLT